MPEPFLELGRTGGTVRTTKRNLSFKAHRRRSACGAMLGHDELAFLPRPRVEHRTEYFRDDLAGLADTYHIAYAYILAAEFVFVVETCPPHDRA